MCYYSPHFMWWACVSISRLSEFEQSGVFLFVSSTELKGLGSDFVFGFVQSMDGERDPRNLLLAFQIANIIIQRGYDLGEGTRRCTHFLSVVFSVSLTFSLRFLSTAPFKHDPFFLPPVNFLSSVSGKFTEELFEVTSCYFPIDFTPVSPCLLSCVLPEDWRKQRGQQTEMSSPTSCDLRGTV